MRMRSRRKQILNSCSDRATFEFAQNSLVEVQSNQESFKNVYFTATVISLKNNQILVEYQNLFDHRNRRLREYVPVIRVRPTPPTHLGEQEVINTNCRFLPQDVVDVFYRNCWWKAVVARVIHGGRKCVVAFHDLDGEEHEFEVAHVRLHWDWVHGTWLRSPNLNQESILPKTQASISKRKRGRPPKKRKRDLMNCVQGRLITHETDPHKLQGSTGAAYGGLLSLPSVGYNSECSHALEFLDLVLGSMKDSKRNHTLEFIGEVAASMKDLASNDFLTDVQSMPFSSIIDMMWKPIERMFSFKWKPHFHGLLHEDRLLRIAGAVGSMVLLVAIVETVSDTETMSKLDLSMLKKIVDMLTMLEVDGFDVNVVRDCVTRLVALRNKQQNLDNEASEIDSRISLHKDKRSRIEIEIREYNDEKRRTEKEMVELDEKISSAQVAKDSEDREIASLQADLLEARVAIQNVEHEFQDITASSVFSCL